MLLMLALILVILAIVGGIAWHPILFLILIVAALVAFGGLRSRSAP
jgi:hypothetical protein